MMPLVRAVAPPPSSKSFQSVRTEIIVAFTLPMIICTNFRDSNQIRITALLLLNIVVRLLYPASYFPATRSTTGILAHPVTHRLIAFVAEFGLYEIWATWAGLDFWGNTHYLWLVVLVGEIISTAAVLLQVEPLGFLEDSTWFLHVFYMGYLSIPSYKMLLFFGGAFGLFSLHLPGRFRLLLSQGRSKSGLFTCNPLFCGSNYVKLKECEIEELLWVIPMLLGQPILTAMMYYTINA